MKILILSQCSWRKDNSFGNTHSNYFGSMDNIEIANIFLLEDMPDYERNVTRYFQIPEGQVLRSLFKPFGPKVGKEVKFHDFENNSRNSPTKSNLYTKLLQFGKKKHWPILFWLREVAWKFGSVDTNQMIEFVNDYKPDIFFLPYDNIYYTNRLAFQILEKCDIPMVMEVCMDHYTLKRVSYNPLFWLDRFMKRGMIRRLCRRASYLYVISQKLKDEYEPLLNIDCKVLYKSPDENRFTQQYVRHEGELKFLFTGNIYANRWKTLSMLVESLKQYGCGRLDIYTSTPISSNMKQSLDVPGVSYLHAPVSQDEVIRLQNQADVLVHAEAFDRYNKSLVRCAISTKIMDYLSVGRCILAIGPDDISSIEYLKDNGTALTATSQHELDSIISSINCETIELFSKKSSEYVSESLNPLKLRESMYNELNEAIIAYKNHKR